MTTESRFWIGSNGKDTLIFDREMQIEGAAHVFLWSLSSREMERYAAELARPLMKTVKDDQAISSAIESYLVWHKQNGMPWFVEERQYQGGLPPISRTHSLA